MSSNNDNNNNEGQPPTAKRQRRSLGASDRVVLDVGGTKFITSASTLTSNSAYFASLLSDNWIKSNNGDEIFIDQDPAPFKVLLAYMRRGVVMVDDINIDVLLLADFLGIERLLLAVKVRWYCNIGKGPVVTTDDEIAVAFDQQHGGIMKAITSGLFPHFLKPNDVDAEKEFATIRISKEASTTPGGGPSMISYIIKEVGKPSPGHSINGGLHIALNGLHLNGYMHHENKLRTVRDTYTFSRRKHATTDSEATDILIPNDGVVGHERNGRVKQFAFDYVKEDVEIPGPSTFHSIHAPAEFCDDESKRSIPFLNVLIPNPGPWLEDNGFVTRENEYEGIFREHHKDFLADNEKISIFTRMISKSRDDSSW